MVIHKGDKLTQITDKLAKALKTELGITQQQIETELFAVFVTNDKGRYFTEFYYNEEKAKKRLSEVQRDIIVQEYDGLDAKLYILTKDRVQH